MTPPSTSAQPLKRRRADRAGRWAELACAALLAVRGYRILARRFRTPVGELDIVARRGRTLVFVEVKARDDLDAAAQAITEPQRRRLVAGAEAWLALNPRYAGYSMRFDAVLVAPRRLPRHIADTFRP